MGVCYIGRMLIRVCTPTQCVEPISVSVFKKFPEKEEILSKSATNE